MLTLLLACTSGKLPDIVIGDPDSAITESGDDTGVGEHTGETEHTGDPGTDDTGPVVDPDPTDIEVCYMGPNRRDDACIALVAWDSSWGDEYDYADPYQGSAQYAAPVRFIDLDAADAGMSLAPNFVLSELMQSRKGRFGIYQPGALEHLQDIRDNIGAPLVVNSGYRSVSYNAGVGGATYSRHMYGDAADIDSSAVTLEELGDICELEGADYVGYYDAHVHCDWRDDPLEPAFYDATRAARTPAPLPEHTASLRWDGTQFTAPGTGWDEGEPLRRWVALDGRGKVVGRGSGVSFAPPAGAITVEVEVGRAVRLQGIVR